VDALPNGNFPALFFIAACATAWIKPHPIQQHGCLLRVHSPESPPPVGLDNSNITFELFSERTTCWSCPFCSECLQERVACGSYGDACCYLIGAVSFQRLKVKLQIHLHPFLSKCTVNQQKQGRGGKGITTNFPALFPVWNEPMGQRAMALDGFDTGNACAPLCIVAQCIQIEGVCCSGDFALSSRSTSTSKKKEGDDMTYPGPQRKAHKELYHRRLCRAQLKQCFAVLWRDRP